MRYWKLGSQAVGASPCAAMTCHEYILRYSRAAGGGADCRAGPFVSNGRGSHHVFSKARFSFGLVPVHREVKLMSEIKTRLARRRASCVPRCAAVVAIERNRNARQPPLSGRIDGLLKQSSGLSDFIRAAAVRRRISPQIVMISAMFGRLRDAASPRAAIDSFVIRGIDVRIQRPSRRKRDVLLPIQFADRSGVHDIRFIASSLTRTSDSTSQASNESIVYWQCE